jgi:hypothetical protein
MKRMIGRGITAIAAAALCLSAGIVPAQAVAKPTWQLYRVYGKGANNIDAPQSDSALAVPGPDSAWAVFVGCNWPCSNGTNIDFLDHWNGRNWTRVAAKTLHSLDPQMVTASSRTDVWLFGYFPKQRYLGADHWNGRSWTKQYVPSWAFTNNGSGDLSVQFADFGPRSLWIFSEGGYIGQKSAYAARYLNGHWAKVSVPDEVDGVAVLSSTSIWLAGRKFGGQGPEIFLHWNGSGWSKTALPTRVAGIAENMFITSNDDLWVEWAPAKTSQAPFLLRKTGSGWTRVDFPRGYSGFLATGDGSSGLWMHGFSPGRNGVPVFMHWRAGRWTIVKVPYGNPGNVDALAVVPGSTSVWAVGSIFGPGDGSTLNRGAIWRYTQ